MAQTNNSSMSPSISIELTKKRCNGYKKGSIRINLKKLPTDFFTPTIKPIKNHKETEDSHHNASDRKIVCESHINYEEEENQNREYNQDYQITSFFGLHEQLKQQQLLNEQTAEFDDKKKQKQNRNRPRFDIGPDQLQQPATSRQRISDQNCYQFDEVFISSERKQQKSYFQCTFAQITNCIKENHQQNNIKYRYKQTRTNTSKQQIINSSKISYFHSNKNTLNTNIFSIKKKSQVSITELLHTKRLKVNSLTTIRNKIKTSNKKSQNGFLHLPPISCNQVRV